MAQRGMRAPRLPMALRKRMLCITKSTMWRGAQSGNARQAGARRGYGASTSAGAQHGVPWIRASYACNDRRGGDRGGDRAAPMAARPDERGADVSRVVVGGGAREHRFDRR